MAAPTESRAFATIAYEVADAIATITLDRPEQLNALDPTMERELLAVWDLVDAPLRRRVDEVALSPPTFRVAPERVAENLATLIEHCAPQ
jgi:1,4-dihydroxy-2-naphthoyl-CoA synthase